MNNYTQITHEILIIGGGNAGISVAAQLLRKSPDLDIAVIEPSNKHYYQPAWTLVGGGAYDISKTVKSVDEVMPGKVKWIQEYAATFVPEENRVITANGEKIGYQFLVVCPGIQINWDWIDGLKETLGKNNVSSNYSYKTAPYTFESIQKFNGGTMLFTSPATPVKCGGAPQKIMYLAADYLKKRHLLSKATIEFCNAGKVIFGVKKYAKTLNKVCERYGIVQNHRHELTTIDGKKKEATFKVTTEAGDVDMITKKFDMIHVTPPQSAPDFIRNSPLADANGWLNVNKHTLQHTQYANIFGIGDVTNTPNAKTGAAVRKQAPVLVNNLLETKHQQTLTRHYNGYGSCPLVTGYGKLVLAEFDYEGNVVETFPFDQSKERYSMYFFKKRVLPWLYWNRILKGKA